MDFPRFKVSLLKIHNVAVLCVSAVAFLISIFYKTNHLIFISLTVGFLSLFYSGFITTYSIFRVSFIFWPQEIVDAMRSSKSPLKTITIMPNLIDKQKLKFYLEKIDIVPSENYDINAVAINGKSININKNENTVTLDIREEKSETFQMKISFQENITPVSTRKIDFQFYYSKRKGSKLLKFKDEIRIS